MAPSHLAVRSRSRLPVAAVAVSFALVLAGCTSAGQNDSSSQDASTQGSGSATVSNGPCSGRSFTVDADGAQLVLDGRCGDIVVDADQVTLNIDDATSLVVNGDDVTVIANGRLDALSLHGESDKVNGADMGTVTVDGVRGEVIAREISSLTTSGEENTVNWDSGVDAATDSGKDNVLIFNGG